MQSVLTVSIYSIVSVSALYFAVGFVLHMVYRFNAPKRVQPAPSPVVPAPVVEPVIETAPVVEEYTVEEFAIAEVIPVTQDDELEAEVVDFDISGVTPVWEREDVKLPLEEMTFAELQQACKDRWISIRIGSKWVKKTELIKALREAKH